MQSALCATPSSLLNEALSHAQLSALVQQQAHTLSKQSAQIIEQSQQLDALRHQLEWFRRQLFGQKSERFACEPDPAQMHLGEVFAVTAPPLAERQAIPAHTRPRPKTDLAAAQAVPFFDESRVPVHSIVLLDERVRDLKPEQYEVIEEKVSYRLAQRPGSYVVLKYCRPLIKIKATQALLCDPAPVSLFEHSRADVSFAAGLLIDKFLYHLPLYRQHQRLSGAGITVSRPWLTQLAQATIRLLEPIHEAQFASIRCSRVTAMDETPIKAGRAGHGKMHQGYFWPIYGEHDEVCFPFHPSRSHEYVGAVLGLKRPPRAVLLSDGYAAYARYAAKSGLTHAQCWAHARRALFDAQNAEPAGVAQALEQVQALYAIEAQISEQNLLGEAKQLHRLTHSKPRVQLFFDWVERQLQRSGFTPSNPFIKALNYVRERRAGLEVFLIDPDVPIDTNHLERALRAIPMGRKAWLFCWTELGAKHVGIVQSLIVTCRLHRIDPYTYLVDVLQRVAEHPASRVAQLTPRLWKQHFAANPMRSDLHLIPA